MARCFVIGGGFAGLSAGVYLSSKNHSVEILEASPKLGGRAYSFNYDKQNDIVDNGQHILMGCYNHTIDFLKMIGEFQKIDIQKNLDITFVDDDGECYKLSASKLFYPFNLMLAILNYGAVSMRERFKILKLFLKLLFSSPTNYGELSTKSFLVENGQTDRAISAFWEILHVGIMNCKLSESSAEMFVTVLKKIFFTGSNSSLILLPKTGLSELYCKAAEDFINRNNGNIRLSTKLISLTKDENNNVIEIITDKGRITDFDYVVLAVSPNSILNLLSGLDNTSFNMPDFKYSPILTCHIWLRENKFKEKFYGLINSNIHWVFNHDKHITLVTSAAYELIDLPKESLFKLFIRELRKYFPYFSEDTVSDYLIIKEKRATFISDNRVIKSRKLLNSNYGNLIFAGDWSNTGFPSTIEGAVKSGKLAAERIEELQQ